MSECPKGYPRLAAFQCSDENFMIYRKFGYLQARLLLEKQDELCLLGDELKDLDKELHASDELWTRTRKFIHDKELRARRSDLMHRIELSYCSYCKSSTRNWKPLQLKWCTSEHPCGCRPNNRA